MEELMRGINDWFLTDPAKLQRATAFAEYGREREQWFHGELYLYLHRILGNGGNWHPEVRIAATRKRVDLYVWCKDQKAFVEVMDAFIGTQGVRRWNDEQVVQEHNQNWRFDCAYYAKECAKNVRKLTEIEGAIRRYVLVFAYRAVTEAEALSFVQRVNNRPEIPPGVTVERALLEHSPGPELSILWLEVKTSAANNSAPRTVKSPPQ